MEKGCSSYVYKGLKTQASRATQNASQQFEQLILRERNMILRIVTVVLALSASLTSSLSAGCDRGDSLISEAGGAAGIAGAAGPAGAPGIAGAAGSQGIQGVSGIPGAPGILDFSDFFTLLPGDGGGGPSIAPGTPIFFPQNGPSTGVIVRLSQTSFLLPVIGTYLVLFEGSVDEPGQFMLRINAADVANSVAGRDTGTEQIVGISLVTTTSSNSILEVINPPLNTTALTLTPANGSLTHAYSTHLVIIRIQ